MHSFRLRARALALALSALALAACSDDEQTLSAGNPLAASSARSAALAKGGPKGPGVTGKIAFVHRNHLHVMNPDGSGITELVSSNAVEDYTPSWSKDRSKIIFATNRANVSSIWMVNADFTGLTQLTSGFYAINPVFTPDGTAFAYSNASRTGNWDIYVQDLAAGAGYVQLTSDPASDGQAHYSPDGTKIAFTSYRSGNAEVWTMNADGSNQQRLTYCKVDCYNPQWSPDGTMILYEGRMWGRTLFITAATPFALSLPVTPPMPGSDFNNDGAWSPDGRKIVFSSYRGGAVDLYSVNTDGSALTRLTMLPNGAVNPAWAY